MWFQSGESKFFLLPVLVSNKFDISILDYVSVSTKMQWQNAMWLRRTHWPCGLSYTCGVISFLVSRVRTPLTQGHSSFLFVMCCVGSGLCEELVCRSQEFCRVCLCLTVYDLGTSTNSHTSPQFACSTTERKKHKVYLQKLECSRRLLPALLQCGWFSRVAHYIGHTSE